MGLGSVHGVPGISGPLPIREHRRLPLRHTKPRNSGRVAQGYTGYSPTWGAMCDVVTPHKIGAFAQLNTSTIGGIARKQNSRSPETGPGCPV